MLEHSQKNVENVGFEPTIPNKDMTVFETVTLNHSANSLSNNTIIFIILI